MAIKIEKPGQSAKLKMLVWGPPGVGKTVFLGTAGLDPRTAPVLILDFEGGTQSLKGMDESNIDVIRITSWQDLNDAVKLIGKENRWKTIVIDSISELHIYTLLDILDRAKNSRQDPDMLQQGDYGKAVVQMRRIVRTFRDMDTHLIMTAHSKQDTDPREGTIILPSMAGSVAHEIPGMLEVSAYMTLTEDPKTKSRGRALVLKNYPKVRAKCRTPYDADVPNEIPNPTVTKLLDALGY